MRLRSPLPRTRPAVLPVVLPVVLALLAVLLAGCGGTASGREVTETPPAATRSPGTAPTPSTTTTAPSSPLSVVGLGDSVMAGTACDCDDFLTLYARALAARDDRVVVASNLGVGGLTAAGLGDQLGDPTVAAKVAHAGTVVVTIGANDLVPLVSTWQQGGCSATCTTPAVRRMRTDVAAVLARIRALGPPGQRVLVTSYWNVFEDGDVADALRGDGFADWSDGVTEAANTAICGAATAAGDPCVDLYHAFLGSDGGTNPTDLLADDGDHPNTAGHALIARTLLAATPPDDGRQP